MAEKHIMVQILDAIDDEDRETILRLFRENPEQVKTFTPFGGQTYLGYAGLKGKLSSVKVLIEIGIDVNTGDESDNRRPICSTAANDHYEIVEYLLEKGTRLDVSKSVCNPLFSAIIGRSPRIVKLLLEAGIDSKVVYNSKTMKNMDAVAFALMQGAKECAEMIALWNANCDEELAKVALGKADEIAEKNAYRTR